MRRYHIFQGANVLRTRTPVGLEEVEVGNEVIESGVMIMAYGVLVAERRRQHHLLPKIETRGGTGKAKEPKRAVAQGNDEGDERIIVAWSIKPHLSFFDVDGKILCKHQMIFCKRLSAQQGQRRHCSCDATDRNTDGQKYQLKVLTQVCSSDFRFHHSIDRKSRRLNSSHWE